MSKDDESPSEYEVGYGRPPVGSRFQKGQSGNPTGKRRAKAKARAAENIFEIFVREGNKSVEMVENGKIVRGSMNEIIIKRLFHSAAKGNPPALKLYLQMKKEVDNRLGEARLPEHDEISAMTPEELSKAYQKFVKTVTPTSF